MHVCSRNDDNGRVESIGVVGLEDEQSVVPRFADLL